MLPKRSEIKGTLVIDKRESVVGIFFINEDNVCTILGWFEKGKFYPSTRLDSANRLFHNVIRPRMREVSLEGLENHAVRHQ